jgi:uncharacterized repeat protein (TIGR04138 family)
MSDDGLIEFDLECEECGYNLRSLPIGHRCPECGKPAPPGVASRRDLLIYLQLKENTPIAERIGCSVNAMLFVRDTIAFVQSKQSAMEFLRQISAGDICAGVRSYARVYFNDDDEARELLAEWGIRQSEDVGRIVFGLVRERLLVPSASDRSEDFRGLFAIDTLFDAATE